MGRSRKSGQAPASDESALTWSEERFVEAYVDNNGNATQAYRAANPKTAPTTWRSGGSEWAARPCIKHALDERRAANREAINFTREKGLRMLLGMAGLSLDDLEDVFEDPSKRENYRGLGDKRFGIESAKITRRKDESGDEIETTEVKIISPGERRAAINDLWEKLGLDKDAGKGNWFDGFERLAELVRGAKKEPG